jgi:hypothetical protein
VRGVAQTIVVCRLRTVLELHQMQSEVNVAIKD